jgi:hypothetical protein
VPFHEIKSTIEVDDANYKKGWGLGYSKRKTFDPEKTAYVPSPDTYHGPWMTQFSKLKNYQKCTFGEPYDRIKARVEMENKKIHTQIQFDNVGPASYTPMSTLSKKNSAAYSVRVKLPLIEEVAHFKQANVSPDRY